MEKFKKNVRKVLRTVVQLLIGGIIGGVSMWAGLTLVEGGGRFALLAIILGGFTIGLYLHAVIHEAGHLIAGKLSGYKFVSFSIGPWVIIREEGKLTLKKYGIAGAGGQCLMSPPDVSNEKHDYPFVLYNLGGGLINILVSALFMIIGMLSSGYVSFAFYVLAVVGILLGLFNIIPMRIGSIVNDGMNVRSCIKDAESRRAFWVQLKVAELLIQGVRLRDMPKEWVDDVGVPANALMGTLVSFRCSYLLDTGELEQARDYAIWAVENPGGMAKIHINELQREILFAELIGECRKEEIEKLYTDEVQTQIKAHESHVATQRCMYAYELLYTKDEKNAEERLTKFEKACKHTPYKGEVAGERELIELVNQASKNKLHK